MDDISVDNLMTNIRKYFASETEQDQFQEGRTKLFIARTSAWRKRLELPGAMWSTVWQNKWYGLLGDFKNCNTIRIRFYCL